MPSPSSLLAADRLAATLREQAELIRGRANQLGGAGAAVRWHSATTTAFHRRLDASLETLLHAAAQYDLAADEIVALAAVS